MGKWVAATVRTDDEHTMWACLPSQLWWFLYKYLDSGGTQCQSGPIFTIVNMGYLKHAALCLGKSEIFLVLKYFCSWNIFHLVSETMYEHHIYQNVAKLEPFCYCGSIENTYWATTQHHRIEIFFHFKYFLSSEVAGRFQCIHFIHVVKYLSRRWNCE